MAMTTYSMPESSQTAWVRSAGGRRPPLRAGSAGPERHPGWQGHRGCRIMGVVPVAEEPLASESPTVESPLILGPVLRRVEGNRATVWVEAERPGVVEVRAGSASGSARTFSAHGHHYGFVVVEGLPPESETPYEVHFDGEQAWPPPGYKYPQPAIRTRPADAPVRILFG